MTNELDNLHQSLTEVNFVIKTQQQLIKDFEKYNLYFPSDFQSNAYSQEAIEGFIARHIQDIMKEGETRLLQLLYTIDLPEKEFLSLTSREDFLERLAEKILLREALKVYLRSKFS